MPLIMEIQDTGETPVAHQRIGIKVPGSKAPVLHMIAKIMDGPLVSGFDQGLISALLLDVG